MSNIYYCYIYYRDNNTPFYVGKGLRPRVYNISNHNKWVCRIFKTVGRKNIRIELIEAKNEEHSFQLERHWISVFRADGYVLCNMTDGGEGLSGYTQTQEAKKKISKANLGKHRSNEARERMSKAATGKLISIETRQKISKSNTGKTVSEETKKKMSIASLGKPKSEEHKQKMKVSKSEEHKQKISQTNKLKGIRPPVGIGVKLGSRLSEETKEKMSIASLGKTKSEKHKQNIAKAKKGIKLSEEHKQKISNTHKERGIKPPISTGPRIGRKVSSATKEKLSRLHSGDKGSNAKLTWNLVNEIRERYNTDKLSQKELTKLYNMSPTAIYKIVHNITWKEYNDK